jgi:single-stranded-DNA-specific exonuclease
LMVSENIDDITSLADDINNDNIERRQLDQQITEEAKEIVEKRWEEKEGFSNVVFKENWHKGVVGIVASRLIEKFYRPTIVLTESNGMVTGSARSIKDFNVYDALNACSEHLEQFGGHMYAAGMTLKRENLEPFMEAFEAYAKENLTPEMLIEEQEVDIELGFNQIFSSEENRMKIPKLKRILSQFEPHGPGNMKPVFISKNVFSTDMRLLKEAHIKLSMTQPEHDVVIEGIGFNQSDSANIVAAGMPFDVVYTLESNKWMDRETLQLNIKDLRETV